MTLEFALITFGLAIPCAYHAAWLHDASLYRQTGRDDLRYLREVAGTPINPLWWLAFLGLVVGGFPHGMTLVSILAHVYQWATDGSFAICSPSARIVATAVRWTRGRRAADEYRRRYLREVEQNLRRMGYDWDLVSEPS